MIIHEIWRLELGSNRTKSNLPSDFKQGWTQNIEIYGNGLIIFRGHQIQYSQILKIFYFPVWLWLIPLVNDCHKIGKKKKKKKKKKPLSQPLC
jgi:hypothetical protein